MDSVFTHSSVIAGAILQQLPDPPGYSTVRKLLAGLVEKSELVARKQGRLLVYEPLRSRQSAAKTAL